MKSIRKSLIVLVFLSLPFIIYAQVYSTGLNKVPDRLQESYPQAQPAGLIVAEGSIPGSGLSKTIMLPLEVDLSKYLPEVRSQGKIGSCAAWSTIYYARTLLENKERGWGADSDEEIFAPLFSYNQINRGSNKGTYLGDHFEIAVSAGVPTWKTFPENHNLKAVPDERALIEAAGYKAETWKSLANFNKYTRKWSTSVNTVKNKLAEGLPVVAGLSIYNNFYSYRGGVYDSISGSQIGGHAMCVVGYNDHTRTFKIVNSWGKDWGDEGFLYLSYDLWPVLATRGCAVLYDNVEKSGAISQIHPPANLNAAKGESYDSIKISWSSVEGAAEYILFRADNKDVEFVELARLEGTEYFETSLPPSVHYVYAVKAVDNNKIESYFSPITEGWTIKKADNTESESGKPGIPGDFAAYANNDSIIFKWNVVENAKSYIIYKWNDKTEQWIAYASSLDNYLIIHDKSELYLESCARFIVLGKTEDGEGFASDSLYVDFSKFDRENPDWEQFIKTASMDDSLISESLTYAFDGTFYRTHYFNYEYTLQQFKKFYELEQIAFQKYRTQETESFQDYRKQEEDAFSKWRANN